MATGTRLPSTLIEAIRYFSDPDVSTEYVAKLRWPDGPTCPRCGAQEYSYLSTRRLWKCKGCKKQYSVKLGTIFEDSAVPLDKWLAAIWLIANSKNGISSHELARSIGVTQKTGWFVLHRIRLAMQTGTFEKLDGEVEVDESYVGGLGKFMHADARKRKMIGRGSATKTPVVGALERGGDVRAAVVPDVKIRTLHRFVTENVEEDATVYTDALRSYSVLDAQYAHKSVDHGVEYVSGSVYTNTLENFWTLLKRGIKGTYVNVDPVHLFRYVDERAFTFNQRKLSDLGRFTRVLQQVTGRRLTYAELTGKV